MKGQSVFKGLDLMMLPNTESTLVFENEFMLADNFKLVADSGDITPGIAYGYPMKMNFTMTLFCVAGNMRVRLNLKEYELHANDVLIVLPESIGECLELSPDCHIAFIASAGNRYLNDNSSPLVVMFRKYLVEQALLHTSSEEMQEIMEIYHLMRRKISQPGYEFTRGALQGYMQVLSNNGYQWITNYYNTIEREKKSVIRQQVIFDRFLELVQIHFRKHRSVSFYADKLCLTPKYLSQVIHQISGRYAGDWIDDYVILEAKALLKSNEYTVSQISDMLNFASLSFFGKYFKAAVGCSPKQYMTE